MFLDIQHDLFYNSLATCLCNKYVYLNKQAHRDTFELNVCNA